jgi:hypothetical protein
MGVPSATIVYSDTSVNTFVYGFFQSVQYHVCESRGDNTTLWGSCLCRKKFVLVNKSSFKPLGNYLFINEYIIDYPVMTDIVKTPFDVTFQYPRGAVIS